MRSVTSNETSNNQLNTRPFKPIVFKTPTPPPNRVTKTVQLSAHTAAELDYLTEEYQTGENEIIEWSVAHFSYSRTKGE